MCNTKFSRQLHWYQVFESLFYVCVCACVCACVCIYTHMDFPGGASGKESACQFWRHKRHGFDPWVVKILYIYIYIYKIYILLSPVLLPMQIAACIKGEKERRLTTTLLQFNTHTHTRILKHFSAHGTLPITCTFL